KRDSNRPRKPSAYPPRRPPVASRQPANRTLPASNTTQSKCENLDFRACNLPRGSQRGGAMDLEAFQRGLAGLFGGDLRADNPDDRRFAAGLVDVPGMAP